MHLTILGKRWRFRWTKRREMPHTLGECDDKTTTNKEIRIRSDQSEFDILDVIIHEILHAADEHKSEEWVLHAGTDIARALWRLGYRRVGEAGDATRAKE